VIAWRGTKIHPEDLEATAAQCGAGFGELNAAFSVDVGNEEQPVLVQELSRPLPPGFDAPAALRALTAAMAARHGVRLFDAVLVRAGTVPRTTSGKVQRRRCRALYLSGELHAAAYAALRAAWAVTGSLASASS
jgi:acyl-CoA synthetase (AMP-forming)/AMP-acid ligase II